MQLIRSGFHFRGKSVDSGSILRHCCRVFALVFCVRFLRPSGKRLETLSDQCRGITRGLNALSGVLRISEKYSLLWVFLILGSFGFYVLLLLGVRGTLFSEIAVSPLPLETASGFFAWVLRFRGMWDWGFWSPPFPELNTMLVLAGEFC